MKDLRFAVILAYYNRPQMVLNALESLQAQKYRNFETIVIDDGSEQGFVENLAKLPIYREINLRFVFTINDTVEKKISQGGSRHGQMMNEAIKISKADYFIILCDDDALMPNYLDEANEALKKNPVAYGYCKVRFYNPNVEKWTEHRPNADINFPTSTYALNLEGRVVPMNNIDGSQMICNTACFQVTENPVAYPYPQTRNLDAALYQQLYERYGECPPLNIYGQIKAAFPEQLGNIQTRY